MLARSAYEFSMNRLDLRRHGSANRDLSDGMSGKKKAMALKVDNANILTSLDSFDLLCLQVFRHMCV